MKATLLTLFVAGSLVAAFQDKKEPPKPEPSPAPKEAMAVKSANVKWTDSPSIPGAKVAVLSGDPTKGPSVVMLKFPKGTTVAPHWHTAMETGTVVSGTMVFGTGETVDAAKGTELGSGGYVVIPSKSPHWAIVKEETIISAALDKAMDFNLCAEKK